eukprot:GEMP01043437.1.p1 GENE.GEMP01043437.1~~GEMP01043437.1.p1  ORF type:complete len:261 (+),score=40.78 GEMP01043437.1:244-1026(+)
MMLLTFFATASALDLSRGDPLGCPHKYVGFVEHAMNSSARFHTWEYVCSQSPEYNTSIVGESERCWVNKGVLPNATFLPIPCCKEPSFAKHMTLCTPTKMTCRDAHCPPGTKVFEGAESRHIGVTSPHPEPGIVTIPLEICCEPTDLPRCTVGNYRQPEGCMCGDSAPRARCLRSQFCRPEGNGECATGEFEEYMQSFDTATTPPQPHPTRGPGSALSGRMLAVIISAVVCVVLLIVTFAWCFVARGRKVSNGRPNDEEV